MMMAAVTEINWRYLGDAIPAFVTICAMPFTYSIANGLIGGIFLYFILNGVVWLIEKASRGRIVPPNKSEKDPWSWQFGGGILPPWMMRLGRGKKDFWREDTPITTESTSDVPGEEKMAMTGSGDSAKGHPETVALHDQEKSA